jgi:hypothetical protein
MGVSDKSVSWTTISVLAWKVRTYPIVLTDSPRGVLVRMPSLHPCWRQLLAASPETVHSVLDLHGPQLIL